MYATITLYPHEFGRNITTYICSLRNRWKYNKTSIGTYSYSIRELQFTYVLNWIDRCIMKEKKQITKIFAWTFIELIKIAQLWCWSEKKGTTISLELSRGIWYVGGAQLRLNFQCEPLIKHYYARWWKIWFNVYVYILRVESYLLEHRELGELNHVIVWVRVAMGYYSNESQWENDYDYFFFYDEITPLLIMSYTFVYPRSSIFLIFSLQDVFSFALNR